MAPTMEDTWLERFSRFIARVVPDAITAGVFLTLLVAVVAIALGNSVLTVVDAYYQGLWMLLSFTMQMTLIVVLSSALSVTPALRKTIAALARMPRTANQMVITAFLANGICAYFYWGLGYAMGPIIAVLFAGEAERRRLPVDFPFLLAVTSGAQAVWQYGLSSSAPLLVATQGHFLQNVIGVIPLSATIWSPAAILHEVLYTSVAIFAACRLMPKAFRPISKFPESCKLIDPAVAPVDDGPPSFSKRLEKSRIVPAVLCGLMAVWLWYHFGPKARSLDINSLNVTLLFLTLLLHRNIRRFSAAVQQGVASSWAVIVLYHLYAGCAGLIQFTNVGDKAAALAGSAATPLTFPAITAAAGTIFAFFIPSSGGQWTIQGFVTVKAAIAAGISIPRAILALGLGDHMGNFLTPFWYVVVAGIARIDFRTFFGYGMLFAAIWFLIGIVVFTFAPC
jgi:short-chain fatty acids transporter